MSEIYQPAAYRSDAIPNLPAGGHPKMDRVFDRLAWGLYQTPVIPNTVEAQLSYAGLFQEPEDAEDGYPWGEKQFSIRKGFLGGLQGFFYTIYMCSKILFFLAFLPLLIGVMSTIVNNLNVEGFVFLFKALLYLYGIIGSCYFGGKYGHLLVAYLSEKRQRANPTGLYRREGLVRIKTRKTVFEAPFIEFDAYRVHTPSGRGGRYYNLVLQHRYSDNQLWMKGLLADAMNPREVNAYWDMIQQFMDVSHPLPDVPIFEPFRPRDPLTAEVDERQGRDPFKWRKITSESWQKNYKRTCQARLQNAKFNHSCLLDAHIEGRGLPLPEEPRGTMLA